MKHLCCLAMISLLSAQAYAGVVLPELGRSKARANSSAVAVGFSERKAFNAGLAYTMDTEETNGRETHDRDTKLMDVSLFMTSTPVKFELGTTISGYKQENTNAVGSDGHNYDFNGTFAVPFGAMTAGVGVQSTRDVATSNLTTKDTTSDLVFSPAFGMKVAPNMAFGLGVNYKISSTKSVVVNTSRTVYPKLKTTQFFAGFAYGVDRKTGAEGFGVEGVVYHTPKKRASNGNLAKEAGSSTELALNGNYITDKMDMDFGVSFTSGKDYTEKYDENAYMVFAKSEFEVWTSLYLDPMISYVSTESGTNTESKGLGLGLGVGTRTATDDIELSYAYGKVDTDPSDKTTNAHTLALRYSYYF